MIPGEILFIEGLRYPRSESGEVVRSTADVPEMQLPLPGHFYNHFVGLIICSDDGSLTGQLADRIGESLLIDVNYEGAWLAFKASRLDNRRKTALVHYRMSVRDGRYTGRYDGFFDGVGVLSGTLTSRTPDQLVRPNLTPASIRDLST